MASQRFCLRWNNHQSNLLSVFDQLLHAETFTDVTLAVEGQYLKAHKMVLSACSPYFQALFVNHPEKHPIVILKDITYADMKSLLDFMYRGEVSVDQERLTAFLRVAESLRIKGLTEVNDEKPASNNNNSSNSNNNNNTNNNNNSNTNSAEQTQTPPPQLHRIQPYLMQQQRKAQGMMLSNPLLGSALTMPKRKRGRPRKLSGCSNGTADDFNDYESRDNLVQGSPELLEMKVNADIYPESSDDNGDDDEDSNEQMDTSEPLNKSQLAASSSKDSSIRKDNIDNSGSEITPTNYSNYMRYGLMVPKSDASPQPSPMKIRINPLTQTPSTSNLANALQQLHNDSINNNAPNRSTMPSTNTATPNSVSTSLANSMVTNYLSNQLSNPTQSTVPADVKPVMTPTGSRPPQRRRVRRKANSPADDQAEHLTEMSVRGLNLFRYATIYEGIYQCTECAKENIQKTFKNKYSFQRHAFLYHEGTQRKVFPCPVCSKEFSRPDKMKNHMKMTHEAFMPKVEVYPLSYLMGGGGDMPQASPGAQQPTNQQQKKLQQQLQNSQMKDNVSQQIQSILNSQVENMVVTPQIQHLLNSQRMGDSASGTSTPSPTLSNHQQQQQQQLLQKLQQQLTNQQTSTQNQTSTQSQSPQASPSQLRIVSAQSLNESADDILTPSTIRHDDDVRSNDKSDEAMSQFNAQMLNMQQIKVENVGPSSD
ncbi:hypothetical protein HA402_011447 [Bradysia odoriphaga]|nr:hypothetical protein HA402_011447 [Bradysia odoriphaga]